MGKIQHSLAEVSTDFQIFPAGVYDFEITKVEEVQKNNQLVAYRVVSKVLTPGELFGKSFSDFINLLKKDGTLNEVGLASLKRYFETVYGKDEVKGWTDDDYDTDMLQGKTWKGQIAIESYTKEGETEPRQTNRVKHMEKL